jgi:transcriptional regulator with XRE-family HTH domain
MNTGNFTWEDVQRLRAQDCTQQEIADKLGTSRSTISRVLAAGPPTDLGEGPRLHEVDAIAREMGDVDAGIRARIGLARSLAAKLDQVHEQRTAASAVGMANLARQYRDTLDELNPSDKSDQQWLVDLFRGTPEENQAESDRYRDALGLIASSRSDGTPQYMEPQYTASEACEIARKALSPEHYQAAGDD